MTTSRKIAIAALLVAIGVLVWDKTRPDGSITQPASAQAHNATTNKLATAPPPGPTNDSDTLSTPDVPPADDSLLASLEKIDFDAWLYPAPDTPQPLRLQDLALQPSANPLAACLKALIGPVCPPQNQPLDSLPRDLFTASPTFLSTIEEKVPVSQSSQQPDLPATLPVLSGILIGQDYRCALLDGRLVFLGKIIGPWELVNVQPDKIELLCRSTSTSIILKP